MFYHCDIVCTKLHVFVTVSDSNYVEQRFIHAFIQK